jgi:hypothetical protein
MHLQETNNRLESIANRLNNLLSSTVRTQAAPDAWIDGVRTTKEAAETARQALTAGLDKLDKKGILVALSNALKRLNELCADTSGVPSQWLSHVDLVIEDLAAVELFLKGLPNKRQN